MKSKALIAMLLVLAAGFAGWYFFIRKATPAPVAQVAALTAVNAADAQCSEDLINIARQALTAEGKDPDTEFSWMMPYIVQYFNGTATLPDGTPDVLDPGSLINGKITKSGAVMQLVRFGGFGDPNSATYQQAYDEWAKFKGSQYVAAVIAL